MNYLKNPIILGVVACLLIITYMYYTKLQDDKKNKDGKNKPFNFITPLAVGIIVWFIAETVIPKTIQNPIINSIDPIKVNPVTQQIAPVSTSVPIQKPSVNNINVKKIGGNSETICTEGTNTYNIISKDNIKLPSMDVFIDLANF